MEIDRLREIGKIIKPHSYRGAVIVGLNTGVTDEIENVRSLFLLIEGRAVPFMVESASMTSDNTLLVSFDGYDSPEKIAEFNGCAVFCTDDDSSSSQAGSHLMLVGYRVFDNKGYQRGTITSMSDNRSQWLATITRADGTSFLLPVHDDLIAEVNSEEGYLQMDFPEGIEDL
jgi:16S rRNA processing protein RimM